VRLPLRALGSATEIRVKVTPRAGRDGIAGLVAGTDGTAWLAVRLRSAPADGKANAALLQLLAEILTVPASKIAVVAGAAARWKRLRIEADPSEVASRLARLLGSEDRSVGP